MNPRFHIYIDESGDPGVKPKTVDEPLWSDWFVLSAVVVAAEREPETVAWVHEMREAIGRKSRQPLHYRKLSDESRSRVCEVLGSKAVRLFVVASHKDTMRRHDSKRLGRSSSQEFYNWCLRLLLERVTQWCAAKCKKEGLTTQPARIVFSRRGGHNYEHLKGYLRKLEAQTLTGNLTLDANSIAPGVIVEGLCEVVPHANLAGLQLADITASAFWQAANSASPSHDLEPASMLIRRLARKGDQRRPNRFGMLLLPFAHQGDIPPADQTIFRQCGYRM